MSTPHGEIFNVSPQELLKRGCWSSGMGQQVSKQWDEEGRWDRDVMLCRAELHHIMPMERFVDYWELVSIKPGQHHDHGRQQPHHSHLVALPSPQQSYSSFLEAVRKWSGTSLGTTGTCWPGKKDSPCGPCAVVLPQIQIMLKCSTGSLSQPPQCSCIPVSAQNTLLVGLNIKMTTQLMLFLLQKNAKEPLPKPKWVGLLIHGL